MELRYEPVNSSFIKSIAHSGGSVMYVKFKNGKEYSYSGITPSMYQAIKTAPSVGQAINDLRIKGVQV
jgi:hypothetical protein